jgi:hypothetical protein
MTNRRPVFTVISMFIAILFAVASRPLLIYSIEGQLADASYNSEDAAEDAGRIAVFAVAIGQFIYGGIGAAIGVVLAAIGFYRRERWPALRWGSLILNLAAAGVVGFSLFRQWH